MNIFIEDQEFELVKFIPDDDHPEQAGTYLLKPVKPDFTKMTKAELIAYIEESTL